jgi:hypothetical protein
MKRLKRVRRDTERGGRDDRAPHTAALERLTGKGKIHNSPCRGMEKMLFLRLTSGLRASYFDTLRSDTAFESIV